MDFNTHNLNRLLDEWLAEDIGRGDLSRFAVLNKTGKAYWIAKQSGIFCGGELSGKIFKRLDKSLNINVMVKDGEFFEKGERLLECEGSAEALLAGERTALNLAMHLSGIATATSKMVDQLKNTGVHLADTRKTTPGLRTLEKYAFRCGGGLNHRLGLDDAAMLKENHLAWSGGIEIAIKAIKSSAPWPAKVIVEAETTTQAEEAVRAGADGVLLDEIEPAILTNLVPQLRRLVKIGLSKGGPGKIILEASGIDPMNLKEYASTGIDLISTSSPITRGAWIDFSMRFT